MTETKVGSSVRILKELDKVNKNRNFIHDIPDTITNDDEVKVTAKLVESRNILVLKRKRVLGIDEINLYKKLRTAFKYNVVGVRFSNKEKGMLVDLMTSDGIPEGFEKAIARLNGKGTLSSDQLNLWTNYFGNELNSMDKVDDISDEVILAVFDDGLNELKTIIYKTEDIKEGNIYELTVRDKEFIENNYICAVEKVSDLQGVKEVKLIKEVKDK